MYHHIDYLYVWWVIFERNRSTLKEGCRAWGP